MPQSQFARSVVTVDGKVTVCYPWDFPENAREPYVDYAVTVLDPSMVFGHILLAQERKINWYDFEQPPNPHKPWLTWL